MSYLLQSTLYSVGGIALGLVGAYADRLLRERTRQGRGER